MAPHLRRNSARYLRQLAVAGLLAGLCTAGTAASTLADTTQSISFTGNYSAYNSCLPGTPPIYQNASGTTTLTVLQTTDAQSTPIYVTTVTYAGVITSGDHTYQFSAYGSGETTVATGNSQGYIDAPVFIYFSADDPALSFVQQVAERLYINTATGAPAGDGYSPSPSGSTCAAHTIPATVDSSFTAPFTLTGAIPPVSYALLPPAILPPGTSFDGTAGTLSGTPTLAGSYPFTVTAHGSINTEALTFTDTLAVAKATSTVLVTPTATTISLGQPLTFQVGVTPNTPTTATGVVTATVQDSLGGTTVLTGTLGVTGTAQLTLPPPSTSGNHIFTVTAVYGGDANFTPGSSGAVPLAVRSQGCVVNGALSEAHVGSVLIQRLAVPSTGMARMLALAPGILTVNNPVLTACSTSGTVSSATILGTAGGTGTRFAPGTALQVTVTVGSSGASVQIANADGSGVPAPLLYTTVGHAGASSLSITAQ